MNEKVVVPQRGFQGNYGIKKFFLYPRDGDLGHVNIKDCYEYFSSGDDLTGVYAVDEDSCSTVY